jgi:hypothetical protein
LLALDSLLENAEEDDLIKRGLLSSLASGARADGSA